MKLEKITLQNYRNFTHYEIDLAKQATILIGKNGAGKTNLLSAIKHSLNFIFSKKRGAAYNAFLNSSEQRLHGFLSNDPHYSWKIQDFIYPISIEAEASLDDQKIAWDFTTPAAGRGLVETKYKEAYDRFWDYHLFGNNQLPLLAYFSDSFPHKTSYIGAKVQRILDAGFFIPQNYAYYKWDEDLSCIEIWRQYFTTNLRNIKFGSNKADVNYYEFVKSILVAFTKPISEYSTNVFEDYEIQDIAVEAQGQNDLLILICKTTQRDIRHVPFTQLPQGYNRLFSIVFDIANRSYILKQQRNNIHGIILIDELELHLHPSIAQIALKHLLHTFPNVQFIITTHSPLIITNFKQDENNILYQLYKTNNAYENQLVDDIFGIDYNSGLRYFMDTPERDSNIEKLLQSFEYWKTAGNKENMDIIRKEALRVVGNHNSKILELFK